MKYKPWPKRDPVKNHFQLPNEICLLKLSPGALAVYSHLLCCENRNTYQCWPSYKTIGRAVKIDQGIGKAEPQEKQNQRRRKGETKTWSQSKLTEAAAHWKVPSGQFFSVCGLFCGQWQEAKVKAAENVLESKRNPALSAEKAGLCGAAIRI